MNFAQLISNQRSKISLIAFAATVVSAVGLAGEAPQLAELHCVVMPSAVVDVSSGVGGRVGTIGVERGDTVRAGQIVAVLESGVERANLALAQTRADLGTEIHLREVRKAFEERKRERTKQLRMRRVVSVHEQDEAETDAELAGWQLRQALDNQLLARLERERAAEVLERRKVRSPIDGVVVERFKWPGEYVEQEPILRVARLDLLWVEVAVPVALHGDIRSGMLAEVMTETQEDKAHEARVTVIDPMGDPSSGTFRVRLELPNPDLRLLGGIRCKARFPDLAPAATTLRREDEMQRRQEAASLSRSAGRHNDSG